MQGDDLDHDYEIGEHDERDEEEQRQNPNPAPLPLPSQEVEDSVDLSDASGADRVRTVNRALPAEAVARCEVVIAGTSRGTTNASGNLTLNLSSLGDGEHALSVMAPDVTSDPAGPGVPANTNKDRVWRPFSGTVKVEGGRIVDAQPQQFVKLSGNTMQVQLGPVWMRARLSSNRVRPPDMIVIHHTAGTLEGDVREFLGPRVSVHYLVAPNGEVYKFVDDARKASHAGFSHWQGREDLNDNSIGIEITHQTGNEYPPAQVDAVVALVRGIKAAFPDIPAGRVIGHSDIGINRPEDRPPKRHGRKSTDPGSAFPWERIEALGLSFQPAAGTVKPGIYGGFFQAHPSGRLRSGDNDAAHRYDGVARPGISGAIRELQEDLQEIGYFCPTDGDFGRITSMALQMFQQHMFSGSRRTGMPDQFNSGDGRLDRKTAELVKRVLGEVEAVPVG